MGGKVRITISIDEELYKKLSESVGEKWLKGEKASISSIVEEVLKKYFGGEKNV